MGGDGTEETDMSLIRQTAGSQAPRKLGSRAWIVRDVRYENSAAKFWSSLIDEIIEDMSACDAVSLQALCGGFLTPEILSPEASLQKSLESLDNEDLRDAFHDTLQEMELIGLPAPVKISLASGGREILTRNLPLDCADADLLPFLLVWLLEWAEITEFAWNNEEVHGDFSAADRERRYLYRLRFTLESRHLSEGLFDRKIAVRFGREGSHPQPPTGAASGGEASAHG